MTEPILVWGGGAIGGTLAAYWARAGIDVLLVDLENDHVTACRTHGLEITGPVDEFVRTIVWCLERRLPLYTPDESVLGLLEIAWDVRLNVVVSTRGDRAEIAKKIL